MLQNIDKGLFQEDEPSMEEMQVGKSTEIEYTWYVLLNDRNVLNTAQKSEHHEQAEYWLADKEGNRTGVIRSRMVDGGEVFELTIKDFKPGDHRIADETSLFGNQEAHDSISNMAHAVRRKVRHIFPTTVEINGEQCELIWEVDVFIDKDGNQMDLVKIDLEVPTGDINPPPIPFSCDKVIEVGPDLSDEDKAELDAMYDASNIKEQPTA